VRALTLILAKLLKLNKRPPPEVQGKEWSRRWSREPVSIILANTRHTGEQQVVCADNLSAIPASFVAFFDTMALLPARCVSDANMAPAGCPGCRHTLGWVNGGVLHWLLKRISSSKILVLSSA